MIRLLLAFLLIFQFSFAEDDNVSAEPAPSSDTVADTPSIFAQPTQPQIVYLSYGSVPSKIINGEIFSITVKSLSTDSNYQDISFTFENGSNIVLIDDKATQAKEGNYFYDTFYFQATGSSATLPDIVATASNDSHTAYPTTTTLKGQSLNIITLNPKSNFSNIIAEDFNLITHKITNYDKDNNIVLFTATATRSDLSRMKIKDVTKQGIESIDNSFMNPKITYYAIIKKGVQSFDFTYYNLKDQTFEKVSIPIVIDDDKVTTMSDLDPKDQQFTGLKITITVIFLLALFALIMWKKKYKFLIILILPLGYIIYLMKPADLMCVKQGSKVYLLPLTNGTVFDTIEKQESLEIEGESGDFKKVKLSSDKIGWIRNEDTCSN